MSFPDLRQYPIRCQ